MSNAKAIIRIFILIGVVLATVAIATVSVNAAFLPGCESCHLVTPSEPESKDAASSEQESRSIKVNNELSSHKDIECAQCHVDKGIINRLAFGSRMTFGMMLPVVDGSNFDGLSQFNKRCMSCHQEIVTRVSESKGIRIDHALCSTTAACASCHATVGHRLETEPEVTYSMDGCMSCHSTLTSEFRDCSTCHVARASSERRQTNTNWAITHGPDWERMHGMGDLSTCTTCHTSEMCGRCHGVAVPHPSRFFARHGEYAQDKDENCTSCHSSKFCSDCHGTEMPHPKNFTQDHSSVASSTNDASCLVCHSVKDCQTCHAAHVHPGGSIGTIDGTVESRDD